MTTKRKRRSVLTTEESVNRSNAAQLVWQKRRERGELPPYGQQLSDGFWLLDVLTAESEDGE